MTDAARQIGVTGGTRLSYDKLISLEQGNGGWRIRATMTATYPDGAKQVEMYCRATPSDIIQLDFSLRQEGLPLSRHPGVSRGDASGRKRSAAE